MLIIDSKLLDLLNPSGSMRLLDTRTFKLRSFISPEAVEEGYAILSHVWDAQEQTFQDIQAIHVRCATSGEDPRSLLSEKVWRSCEIAASHGYRWLWIDTCCIDKTSSAELSEAINSMYRYYSHSEVCYAYLRDVTDIASHLHRSVWHTRGWTLQELIAPRCVLFVSKYWRVLGSKADLAKELEHITGIPIAVLQLAQRPSEISITRRMSWAAHRTTTRKEDEAYSLLGIFDVNMPTLYGEGERAFQRLQEEILKKSTDTTLFAWGITYSMDIPIQADRDPSTANRAVVSHGSAPIPSPGPKSRLDPSKLLPGGLFARSPADFAGSEDIDYSPHFELWGPNSSVRLPSLLAVANCSRITTNRRPRLTKIPD